MCFIIGKEQGLGQECTKGMSLDHFFRSVDLVRVPSLCIYLAKSLQLQVPDTRSALAKEMRIDMKLKQLAKCYHEGVYHSQLSNILETHDMFRIVPDCNHTAAKSRFIKTRVPTKPATRGDIASQELINAINALLMD
jgi:hypothetical protein